MYQRAVTFKRFRINAFCKLSTPLTRRVRACDKVRINRIDIVVFDRIDGTQPARFSTSALYAVCRDDDVRIHFDNRFIRQLHPAGLAAGGVFRMYIFKHFVHKRAFPRRVTVRRHFDEYFLFVFSEMPLSFLCRKDRISSIGSADLPAFLCRFSDHAD